MEIIRNSSDIKYYIYIKHTIGRCGRLFGYIRGATSAGWIGIPGYYGQTDRHPFSSTSSSSSASASGSASPCEIRLSYFCDQWTNVHNLELWRLVAIDQSYMCIYSLHIYTHILYILTIQPCLRIHICNIVDVFFY